MKKNLKTLTIITIILLSGCARFEILPNLCYDDQNGTRMCGIICNEDRSICIDTHNPKLGPDLECDTEDGQCHWPKNYYDPPKESTCVVHPEADWVTGCEKVA